MSTCSSSSARVKRASIASSPFPTCSKRYWNLLSSSSRSKHSRLSSALTYSLKRRMSFEPREYLRHILVEADYLMDRSRTLSWEQFEGDETLRSSSRPRRSSFELPRWVGC